MIPVTEALARITGAFTPLPAEQVALADALGRVLAEDVTARITQPPVAVSAMDGYGVRAADVAATPVTLRRVGEAPAGAPFDGAVGPGEAVRIFTGGPVPAGADTIIMQEVTEADGERVTILEPAPKGRYIRAAGLDFKEGDVGLTAGRRLTARDIGLAAAMNVPWPMVRRRPRIALLATGDELVEAGGSVGPAQIISSNTPALAAFAAALGATPVDLGIARDTDAALQAAAESARDADLLVTTGGVSVGERDLVQSALAQIGFVVDFWKVAMRPGKPLLFGRLDGLPVLGLPGNPVSALVCAIVFLEPAIAAMLGLSEPAGPPASALLGADLGDNDARQDYLRARLSFDAEGNRIATPFGRQDSAMLSHLAHADCLVVRPPHAPAAKAGTRVEIIPLPAAPALA